MSTIVEKAPRKDVAIGRKKPLLNRIYEYRWFYVMFLPVLIFAIIFFYAPIGGLRYAFYNYNGVTDPTFVGFENFEKMFSMSGFWGAFANTLVISIVKLLLNTFLAVLISLLLNEIVSVPLKKISQTIVYIPHFLSWVVVSSLFLLIMSPSQEGMVNAVLVALGIVNKGSEIYFWGSKDWWRPVYYLTNIWKDTGWGTIIFMATLSSVDPSLYEAASIDGATRVQKMRFITLPALMSTIIIVLILNLAKIMNLFESVYVLMNDAVVDKADVLQTYIYTQTFNSGALPNYGYTTAVGLVKSMVGLFLVLVCNYASKKVRGQGIV